MSELTSKVVILRRLGAYQEDLVAVAQKSAGWSSEAAAATEKLPN